jgi:hypothetical protein
MASVDEKRATDKLSLEMRKQNSELQRIERDEKFNNLITTILELQKNGVDYKDVIKENNNEYIKQIDDAIEHRIASEARKVNHDGLKPLKPISARPHSLMSGLPVLPALARPATGSHVSPAVSTSARPTTGSTRSPTGSTRSPTGSVRPPAGSTRPPTGSRISPAVSHVSPAVSTSARPPAGSTRPPTGSARPPAGSTRPPTGSRVSPAASTSAIKGLLTPNPASVKSDQEYNIMRTTIIYYIDLRTQYFYLFINNIDTILEKFVVYIETNIETNIKTKLKEIGKVDENIIKRFLTPPFNNKNLKEIKGVIEDLINSQYLRISKDLIVSENVSDKEILFYQYVGNTLDIDEQEIIKKIKEQNKYIKRFLNSIKTILKPSPFLSQFIDFIKEGGKLSKIRDKIEELQIIDDANKDYDASGLNLYYNSSGLNLYYNSSGLNPDYETSIDGYILFNESFYNEQKGGDLESLIKKWGHNIKENIKEKTKNTWQKTKDTWQKTKDIWQTIINKPTAVTPYPINLKTSTLSTLLKNPEEFQEFEKGLDIGLKKLEDEFKGKLEGLEGLDDLQKSEEEVQSDFEGILKELKIDIYNIHAYIRDDINNFFDVIDVVFKYIDSIAIFLGFIYKRVGIDLSLIDIKQDFLLIKKNNESYVIKLNELLSKKEYKIGSNEINYLYEPYLDKYNVNINMGGTLVKRHSPKKDIAKAVVKKDVKAVVKKDVKAVVKKDVKAVVKKTAKAVVKKTAKAVVKKTAKAVVKKTAKAVVKKTAKAVVKKTAKAVVKKTANAVVKKDVKAVVKKDVKKDVKKTAKAVVKK